MVLNSDANIDLMKRNSTSVSFPVPAYGGEDLWSQNPVGSATTGQNQNKQMQT